MILSGSIILISWCVWIADNISIVVCFNWFKNFLWLFDKGWCLLFQVSLYIVGERYCDCFKFLLPSKISSLCLAEVAKNFNNLNILCFNVIQNLWSLMALFNLVLLYILLYTSHVFVIAYSLQFYLIVVGWLLSFVL